MTDPEGTRDATEVTPLVRLVNVLLRRPRVMVGVPLGMCALAILVALIRGPRYEAESLIQPQQRQSTIMPAVAGLAAEFGFNLGGLGQSSDLLGFYPRLLRSDELLREALLTQYRFSTRGLNQLHGDTLSGTLLDVLHTKGRTEAERIRKGIRHLSRSITARTDPLAGTFTLTVEEPWPELAEQVNRRLIELVNQFNREKRQSQAAAEAAFVKGRLTDTQQALQQAERGEARFLAANRLYQGDPQLVFQHDRLQQRVLQQQQLVTSLTQAYERARMDAVRNTPVITVVAPPEGTAHLAIGKALFAAVGLGLGLLIAVGVAFLAEHLAQQRLDHPEEFAEFTRLRGELPQRLLPASRKRLRP